MPKRPPAHPTAPGIRGPHGRADHPQGLKGASARHPGTRQANATLRRGSLSLPDCPDEGAPVQGLAQALQKRSTNLEDAFESVIGLHGERGVVHVAAVDLAHELALVQGAGNVQQIDEQLG
eukprot:14298458-Alexandrium_andersonii.AAC.1